MLVPLHFLIRTKVAFDLGSSKPSVAVLSTGHYKASSSLFIGETKANLL